MTAHVLGADIGGTSVRVGLGTVAGEELADLAVPTAKGGAAALVSQLAVVVDDLSSGAGVGRPDIAAMAIGVPGVVRHGDGGLDLAPNLPSLRALDLARALEGSLGIPVLLDNDVNMATRAEHRYGLGIGLSDLVFISVGTGVGMGVVAGGRIQHGAGGAAGEIGFLPLGGDPFERSRQVHGSLEEVAGGVGVARRYAALAGTDADAVSALEVHARAAAGDRNARQVLDDQARAMALAVVSVQSVLDPALIVFGGGIGGRGDFVDRVRGQVARLTLRAPRIELSSLGGRAGLVGALALAREQATSAGSPSAAT